MVITVENRGLYEILKSHLENNSFRFRFRENHQLKKK